MPRTESERVGRANNCNVQVDLCFCSAATAELMVRCSLICAIGDIIRECELTQQDRAKLCGTDQPKLSKVLSGRMESVTIDKLAAWLSAVGRPVEIHVRPYDRKTKSGQLVMSP